MEGSADTAEDGNEVQRKVRPVLSQRRPVMPWRLVEPRVSPGIYVQNDVLNSSCPYAQCPYKKLMRARAIPANGGKWREHRRTRASNRQNVHEKGRAAAHGHALTPRPPEGVLMVTFLVCSQPRVFWAVDWRAPRQPIVHSFQRPVTSAGHIVRFSNLFRASDFREKCHPRGVPTAE